MVECCHLLLLLVTVISQCGATDHEYYVRPTEPANTSCPGQPCLTFNQYIDNSSYYIQNNTVLIFLPGKYAMERPLKIRNVENVTLKVVSDQDENDHYPQLEAQFSCQSNYQCLDENLYDLLYYYSFEDCSAIQLINVTHVSISGIKVSLTVNVSALRVVQSTDIHIQMEIFSKKTGLEKDVNGCNIGIMANETSHLYVNKLQASNLWNGILLQQTKNAKIKDSMLENSPLLAFESDAVHITNTASSDSNDPGIALLSCNNANIVNISTTGNREDGLDLHMCNNTSIMNVSSSNNSFGMYFYLCRNTSIANIFVTNNLRSGIIMTLNRNTSIVNISASNNSDMGIVLRECINTSITDISITKNQQDGMGLLYCKNTNMMNINATKNQLSEIDIQFSSNVSMTNVSVNYNGYTGIFISHCTSQLQLEDSVFSDVVLLSGPSVATELQTGPAIIKVIENNLIVTNCNFTGNSITSIRAVGSNITIQKDVIFANNQALLGAALHFSQSSVLVLSETSSVIFKNNHAVNHGSIYIDTEEIYGQSKCIQQSFYFFLPLITTSTRCFIRVEGDRSQAKLIFVNNTSGRGGDVVYGGLVALGYDGDWNCLQSFKNVSDMSQQNDLSVISSAPSRVCLCHDGHFENPDDCLTVADPITRNVYPGQTITIPAVVVGQDFGTVAGSVIAQFLPKPHTTCSIDLEQDQQSTQVDKRNCTNLKYTLYPKDEKCTAVLVLKTDNAKHNLQPMTIEDNHKVNESWKLLNENPNYHELAYYFICELYNAYPCTEHSRFNMFTIQNFLKVTSNNFSIGTCYNGRICEIDKSTKFVFPKEIYGYPTFINISFNPCPLGFTLSTNHPFKCDCNHLLQQMPQVACDIQKQTITRDGLVWIGTYNNETVAASKYCPYNYCKNTGINLTLQEPDSEYSNHSITDSQCNYRHSGILCGGCQPGLSLALGSDRCLHCSNVCISLLLPFAMTGFLLVFLIKLLDLTISQGTMNALIFYANVIGANKYLYYNPTSINPMTLFIAWFNLDIGIETCFFNGLTAYIRTWLQFVFPLYIWTIAGLIIILARYNDRVAKVMGNNGVPVLATLFLLSYAKLFNTIIKIVSFTTLHTTQDQNLMWSVDGNIVYLGPEHAPLFAVAVTVLFFLWLPYTLLLLLGQWLHRLDCHLITRLLLKLKPFLDAHYGPFKDRHRYWFGLLLLARVAILLISAIIPGNTAGIIEFSTAILCVLLTFWGQNVYRNSAVRMFATAFFLNLIIINLTTLFSNDNISVASFTLIAVALAQFVGLVLYKVFAIFKQSDKVKRCCVCQKESEDDWDLYEQAALLREMESDSEDSRESDGSIESLPTYGT